MSQRGTSYSSVKEMYVQAESTKPHCHFAVRCQSGKAGESLLTQTICSSAVADPAFSSHSAKYRCPGRYYVVACLCQQVEWYIIRKTPIQVASMSSRPVHCIKRAYSSSYLSGHIWKALVRYFMVDNLAVVQVLQATYCRDTHLMHLIRLLVPLQLLVYCHLCCGKEEYLC